MTLYSDYLVEIEDRKKQGLHPKPIDSGELIEAIISQIADPGNPHREDSLQFFIYNTLPGTTSAAIVKAAFLQDIVLGSTTVPEISPAFALEQLSHMKGGPSTKALIDLALSDDTQLASEAAKVLKTQVFLYEADTQRLKKRTRAATHSFATFLKAMRKQNSSHNFLKCLRRSRSSPL